MKKLLYFFSIACLGFAFSGAPAEAGLVKSTKEKVAEAMEKARGFNFSDPNNIKKAYCSKYKNPFCWEAACRSQKVLYASCALMCGDVHKNCKKGGKEEHKKTPEEVLDSFKAVREGKEWLPKLCPGLKSLSDIKKFCLKRLVMPRRDVKDFENLSHLNLPL